MKKRIKQTFKHITTALIITWIVILFLGYKVVQQEVQIENIKTRMEWIEAQQDNVIELLITGE
tara:strand:+ start:886 stop:1074 length:189 start_codon:yes stop_codon:yes gene_type:complete